MRSFTSLLLIGMVVIALGQALPTQSHSRQKRGFRMNSSNRVAHGFGKRQSGTADDDLFAVVPSSDLMTVQELAQLSVLHPPLAETLIQKFIDRDGDGILTTQELLDLAEE